MGCFIHSLVFRECFLLRRLFFYDHAVPVLLFALLLVLDQRGFVLLHSVLTLLLVLVQVCLVCFPNIPRFSCPNCSTVRILDSSEFW